MAAYRKDPHATLDYAVDWTAWLGGDTISESTWVVTGATVETSPPPSVADGVAVVWLSGGVVGETATVTNTITTAAARIDERTFQISIQQR